MESDTILAHKHSIHNKNEIMNDETVGCFHCLRIFSPSEIAEWIDSKNDTALCPYCGIDSVIGESSGYPITEEFLSKMEQRWFSFRQENAY